MKFIIHNIGMIQNAEIDLNGLTVIAGENDTGKSTIGKTLFCAVKADNLTITKFKKNTSDFFAQRQSYLNKLLDLVFDSQITSHGEAKLIGDNEALIYHMSFESSSCVDFKGLSYDSHRNLKDATFLQTPFTWDLLEFFDDVLRLKQHDELFDGIQFSFKYPYLIWDVYMKIAQTISTNNAQNQIVNLVSNIVGGTFRQSNNKIVYEKQSEQIRIPNIASGIKYFGILQRLAENSKLGKGNLLIIDEPENHLHPEWQLQFAKIIITMIKNYDLTVLVNSHSPYMIEALKVFSDKYIRQKSSFYHNEKKENDVIVNDITNDLSLVFEKLSLPLKALEKIDMGLYDD